MGEAINLVENFKVEKVIFNCGELNDLEQDLIKVLDKKKIPYYSCIKELNIDDNKLYFLNNKDYGIMISINSKTYNNFDKKILWIKFNVNSKVEGIKKSRSGEAPFIQFNINNNIFIGIETTYPKDWLSDLQVGAKINFSNYLSDITYEDFEGWQSLIMGKYECELLKKDNEIYNVKLIVESDEFEKLIIKIDEDINI